MTSTTANIDYIKTNFEYPVLTTISSKPDYDSLKKIKDELKANAGNIQCDLGGGNNGHLGLVLDDAEYACLEAVFLTKFRDKLLVTLLLKIV